MLRELDTAIARLNQEQDPAHIRRVGIAAVFVDRVGGCRLALWRVLEDGRAGGAITSSSDAPLLLGNDDYFTGAWEEMDQVTAETYATVRSSITSRLSGPDGSCEAWSRPPAVAHSVPDHVLS